LKQSIKIVTDCQSQNTIN